MSLFENYVEAVMLKNQELHERARREHNQARILSTVVARTMHQLQHEKMAIMKVDLSVMDLVNDKLSSTEQIVQLPPQTLHPALPPQPVLIDLGQARVIIKEVQSKFPPIAGMAFLCPGDRAIMREAQARLPAKYHPSIQQVIGFDQTTWTLSCLDAMGEEITVYHYRQEAGSWNWQMYAGHRCPFKGCRYSLLGPLERACDRCEEIRTLMTLQVGLILLYDTGYFQEVVVVEEVEPRSYTVNPAGKVLSEQEVTRPVRVRYIRKNVLVKELPARHPVVHPRGSWLEKHAPDEVDTTWTKRAPFEMRTRSGKLITVTPKEAKRIRRLKKNAPERTITQLYAKPPDRDREA